jgi:signal transduction histidine kinase/DNA-binding response OmpR family regulator/ABC-type sugar transport system substrate-binding protein
MAISSPRRKIGILTGYQVYGNLPGKLELEGNTISDYLLHVLQGTLAAGRELDCNLLLGCGLSRPRLSSNPYPAWFTCSSDSTFVPIGPWNTDGLIILTPLISDQCNQLLEELREGGFPIVYAGTGKPAPAVITDNATGIKQAVMHLRNHGHKKIAYIAGYENVIGDSSIRLDAYQSAMKEFNLDLKPELISYGYHTIQGGESAMRKLLDTGYDFTALLTSDYSSALGAVRVLEETGHRIPEDIAIIGFDDYLGAKAQNSPMTTVHQQLFELGYRSVELVLDYIENRRSTPVTIRVPEQLVTRRSCGCSFEGSLSFDSTTSVNQPNISSINQQMTDVVFGGSYHLPVEKINAILAKFIDAFLLSLQKADQKIFTIALEEVLHQIEEKGDDPDILQPALSILRRNPPSFTIYKQHYQLAQDLIDQARLLVNEQSHQRTARFLVQQANTADTIGIMTAKLQVALDEGQILNILNTHLPSIGIQHVNIVIFNPSQDNEDPVANSLLWLPSPAKTGVEIRHFPSRQFPPRDLYDENTSFQVAILPLLALGEQIGYIVYDTDDLENLSVITQQVSAALLTLKLYRQAAEGQRLAEKANKMKTRFLSTVSHELRTPLNLIVGLSELILHEQSQGKTPNPQDLERIYSNSKHLGFLIRDVLDLASSDAGQLRLTIEPLDLVEVLRGVIGTGEQLARDKGLEWYVKIPDQSIRVLGDRTRLRQIAFNLISNAVKFTTEGSITLSVNVNQDEVTVSIADTGLGVPLDEQISIFDEFHQAERTASRGFGGIGLGLAISKHLIDLHGGKIGVLSSGIEGDGATFYFTLSLMSEQNRSKNIFQDLYGTITLVTDDLEIATQVRDFLEKKGFNISIQLSTRDIAWISILAKTPPAAILLDKKSTANQGWDILRNLKDNSQLADVPVVFFSYSGKDVPGVALELDYQTKPLTTKGLQRILMQSYTTGQPIQIILVVDDDQNILDLHTRMIQSQLPDCRVIHAHDGLEALEILRNIHPDLILLDLMMPKLDGFGVLEAMQTTDLYQDIPVVILTAQTLTESDMARLNRGVSAILEKGIFSAEETFTHIASVLNRTNHSRSTAQKLVRSAMTYIHSNYQESITRESLADFLSISDNYLTNCFQKELGLSPITYVNRYRIRQACTLLEMDEMNITEIALDVGFSDLAYFSKVFLREIGVSPSVYRRGSRLQKPTL